VGTLGDSAEGLAQLQANANATGPLVDIFRRPVPLLAAGQAIAPHAKAMMDISDGLLIDCLRLAQASRCAAEIDMDALPLSTAFIAERGDHLDARLFAATGGDDYALLAALPPEVDPLTLSLPAGTRIARVGVLSAGEPSIGLTSGGRTIELPEILGHEHRSASAPPVADRD
jgi:thiamine-monophosphate kinase